MVRLLLTEADIRRQVKDYLTLKNWFVLYHLQGLGSMVGLPDLSAVKEGRIIFIELKRPGGKQRPSQVDFQRKLEAAGGEYVLCRGIEDLQERGI